MCPASNFPLRRQPFSLRKLVSKIDPKRRHVYGICLGLAVHGLMERDGWIVKHPKALVGMEGFQKAAWKTRRRDMSGFG